MQARENNQKPKEWFNDSIAFIIGVGKYNNFEDLPNAVKDAGDIAALLENSLPRYTIKKLLLNATYGEVETLFKTDVPEAITNENTQMIIYFAGHGFATAKTNTISAAGYILPADASRKNYERFISMQDIYEKLCNLPVRPRHLLLILDCCFAGSFKWNSMTLRGLGTGDDIIYKQRYDRFINSHAWQVLTSSSYNQVSVDSVYENDLSDRGSINTNSPFVFYLKEALAGSADLNNDGLLTISEVQSYIRDHLEKPDPKSVGQQLQTPMLFPLNVDIHDRGEYLFLLPDCPLNLNFFDISENPYRGLLSYNEDTSDSFFGRTSAITSLKAIIDQNQLTVVYGASGTGKSSLVLAGILPKYKSDYSILQFSPGNCGLINLSDQLKEIRKESKCLLYIDQLEEIFTQNSTEEQKEFFQKLNDTLNNSSYQLKLLVSIRSDFESYLDRTVLNAFWTEQKSNFYPVPVLTSTELREIIFKPATQRLIEFNPPGLVDTIANEVENEVGSLPLLSFFMTELYNELIAKNDFTEFTIADYKNAGKVAGAIRRKAKQFYDESQQKKLIEKLILRMISLDSGDYTKQKLFTRELRFPSARESADAEKLLDQLSNATNRLIVGGGKDEIYYEPAHDYLIRAWEDPHQWVQKMGTQKFLLYEQIRKRSNAYVKSHYKSREELMFEPEYASGIAQFYPDKSNFLNADETRFLEESISLRKRNKRVRTIALTSIISLMLLIITGLITYIKTSSYQAETNRLLLLAQQQLQADPTIALNLVEIVLNRDANNTTAKRIEDDVMSDPSICIYQKEMTHGHDDAVSMIDINSNDSLLLSYGEGNIKVWSVQTGNTLDSFRISEEFPEKIGFGNKPFTIEVFQSFVKSHGLGPTIKKTYSVKGATLDSGTIDDSNVTQSVSYFKENDEYSIDYDEDNIYIKSKRKGIKKINPIETQDLLSEVSFGDDSTFNNVRNPPLHNELLSNASLNSQIQNDNGYNIDGLEFNYSGEFIIALISSSVVNVYNLDGTLKMRKSFDGKSLDILRISPTMDLFFVSVNLVNKEEGLVLDLNGNIVRRLESSDDFITNAVFSNDGKFIYTSTNNGKIKKWPLNKNIFERFDYSDFVSTSPISFFRGDILTIVSDNQSLETREVKNATEYFFSQKNINYFNLVQRQAFTDTLSFGTRDSIELSKDHLTFFQKNKDKYDVYDLSKHYYFSLSRSITTTLSSLKLGRNYKYYAMILPANRADVYSSNGKKIISTDSTDDLIFSPDESHFLTFETSQYYSDKQTYKKRLPQLYDISGKRIALDKRPTEPTNDAIFINNEYLLLSTDSLLYKYTINGKLKDVFLVSNYVELKSTENRIRVFSLSESTFALAVNNIVFVIDISGNIKYRLAGHTESITMVSVSQNGRWISTCALDNVTTIWVTKDFFLKEYLPGLSPELKQKFRL